MIWTLHTLLLPPARLLNHESLLSPRLSCHAIHYRLCQFLHCLQSALSKWLNVLDRSALSFFLSPTNIPSCFLQRLSDRFSYPFYFRHGEQTSIRVYYIPHMNINVHAQVLFPSCLELRYSIQHNVLSSAPSCCISITGTSPA